MIGEGIAVAEQVLYAAILWAAALGGLGALGLLGAGVGVRRWVRARRTRQRRQTAACGPHSPSRDSRIATDAPGASQGPSGDSSYEEAA